MFLDRLISCKLEKSYLDSIDDSGNCFIIYLAKLDFSFMRIWYSGLIFSDKEGNQAENSSFNRSRTALTNGLLSFNSKRLRIDGTWERIDSPVLKSLYTDLGNNELIWNCHHPKALTEVRYAGNLYKGLGYAETITLTKTQMRLPFEELRWGRFLSDNYTITWVNWKGTHPLNILFLNGDEYLDSFHKDDIVLFCNGIYKLEFSGSQKIRTGKLSRIFSKMPLFKLFFSRMMLNAEEKKFKARTVFSKNSVNLSQGWSIYEVVTWRS